MSGRVAVQVGWAESDGGAVEDECAASQIMDEYAEKFAQEPAEDGEDGAQENDWQIQRGVQCDCEESALSCENG